MTAGSYCYIGPQGIVHGTTVSSPKVAQRGNVFLIFPSRLSNLRFV